MEENPYKSPEGPPADQPAIHRPLRTSMGRYVAYGAAISAGSFFVAHAVAFAIYPHAPTEIKDRVSLSDLVLGGVAYLFFGAIVGAIVAAIAKMIRRGKE